MKPDSLADAVNLAREIGHVFVATADATAMPHIAAAGRLAPAPNRCVTVTEWFCPGTVANLQQNKHVAIVVWNRDSDTGYQLIGEVQESRDLGILDGYAPALEGRPPLPQVQRQLLIKVERILDFKLAPHSDTED